MKGIEAFAEVKRAIVVAAHPDDLETMCGGTIALLRQRGVVFFSVNCTLGDIGTVDEGMTRSVLAVTRLEETTAAAEILGLEATCNLGRHDGELEADLSLRAAIARLYRLTQADTLFTFDPYWPGQIHPDHRAAAQAALAAYMPSKMPLYHPEQLQENGAGLGCLERVFLFAPDTADVTVDVTAVYDTKLAASIAHVCQFPEGEASLEWMKRLDGEKGKAIEVLYAETFKEMKVW